MMGLERTMREPGQPRLALVEMHQERARMLLRPAPSRPAPGRGVVSGLDQSRTPSQNRERGAARVCRNPRVPSRPGQPRSLRTGSTWCSTPSRRAGPRHGSTTASRYASYGSAPAQGWRRNVGMAVRARSSRRGSPAHRLSTLPARGRAPRSEERVCSGFSPRITPSADRRGPSWQAASTRPSARQTGNGRAVASLSRSAQSRSISWPERHCAEAVDEDAGTAFLRVVAPLVSAC